MALWIPSCCRSSESSLRRGAGGEAAEVVDGRGRLFPSCLHTTLSPAGMLLSERRLPAYDGGGWDFDGEGETDAVPGSFPCFRQTLTQRDRVISRYLRTQSPEDRFGSARTSVRESLDLESTGVLSEASAPCRTRPFGVKRSPYFLRRRRTSGSPDLGLL